LELLRNIPPGKSLTLFVKYGVHIFDDEGKVSNFMFTTSPNGNRYSDTMPPKYCKIMQINIYKNINTKNQYILKILNIFLT
jgi:hypothetical protein